MEIDVRGFSCPIPLMRTQEVLVKNDPAEITVLASSGTAKANVVNLLNDYGYQVTVTDEEGNYRIEGKRN